MWLEEKKTCQAQQENKTQEIRKTPAYFGKEINDGERKTLYGELENAKQFKLNASDAFLEIVEEFKISNLSPITIRSQH